MPPCRGRDELKKQTQAVVPNPRKSKAGWGFARGPCCHNFRGTATCLSSAIEIQSQIASSGGKSGESKVALRSSSLGCWPQTVSLGCLQMGPLPCLPAPPPTPRGDGALLCCACEPEAAPGGVWSLGCCQASPPVLPLQAGHAAPSAPLRGPTGFADGTSVLASLGQMAVKQEAHSSGPTSCQSQQELSS